MDRRFFVTVVAPNKRSLLRLREYELDLFQATGKVTEENEFVIDGLLTLEEVGRLVEDGYHVMVKEESSRKERARLEVVEFEEWIEQIKE